MTMIYTAAKILIISVLAFAGVGFGTYLYAPSTGYIYSAGFHLGTALIQIANFGALGVLAYFNEALALAALLALFAASLFRGGRINRFLNPFYLYVPCSYALGVGIGVLISSFVGHTPEISL